MKICNGSVPECMATAVLIHTKKFCEQLHTLGCKFCFSRFREIQL